MKLLGVVGICVGLGVLGLGGLAAQGQWNTPNPVVSFEKTADGVDIVQKDGVLRSGGECGRFDACDVCAAGGCGGGGAFR